MKMNFLFSGVFWGIVLCLIGAGIIVKNVFDLDFPVGKVVFAVILVLVGVGFLTGKDIFRTSRKPEGFRAENRSESTVVFGSSDFGKDKIKESYSIIFGQGVIDLTGVPEAEIPRRIEIDTVFGNTEIIVPANVAISIKGETVFGSTTYPDNVMNAFGDRIWETPAAAGASGKIMIKTDCVFGSCIIRSR
jgi:predicted membrane protein